ncbi:MAG: DEAD/DEAH box helicase [Thermodesulfobacteriota bacterium]
MALNPIVFTEKVVRSFLRYQLTAYPFADENLHGQMRRLLSLDETRQSPLLKGPYISLSRPFRQGSSVEKLVQDGVFHPHMRLRIPPEITHVYGHQEEAIRAIRSGRTTLISTGTGSGKTECFLYPIVSKCLELRDQAVAAGLEWEVKLRHLFTKNDAGTHVPILDHYVTLRSRDNAVLGVVGRDYKPLQNLEDVRETVDLEFLNYFRGKTQDNTLNSLWFGESAQLNRKALELAMKMAA